MKTHIWGDSYHYVIPSRIPIGIWIQIWNSHFDSLTKFWMESNIHQQGDLIFQQISIYINNSSNEIEFYHGFQDKFAWIQSSTPLDLVVIWANQTRSRLRILGHICRPQIYLSTIVVVVASWYQSKEKKYSYQASKFICIIFSSPSVSSTRSGGSNFDCSTCIKLKASANTSRKVQQYERLYDTEIKSICLAIDLFVQFADLSRFPLDFS